MASRKLFGKAAHLAAIGALLSGGTLLAASPATAAEPDPDDRIRTQINDQGLLWGLPPGDDGIYIHGGAFELTYFMVPAPGHTGIFEALNDDDGTAACIGQEQSTPLVALTLSPWYAQGSPNAQCQLFETVADEEGRVGFRVADGPYEGRFLGDESRGGIVDYAMPTMYDIELVAAPDPAPVSITGPSGSVDTARPVIAGEGAPGATVVVTDSTGAIVGETTVGADGTWSLTPGADLPAGPVDLTATQASGQGETTASASFVIELESAPADEITPPAEDDTADTAPPAEDEPADSDEDPASAPSSLAATGVDAPIAGAWIGASALLAGAALLAVRALRRRTEVD